MYIEGDSLKHSGDTECIWAIVFSYTATFTK